jgi:UDP-N-acetylglucosamine acyltransferase
MSSVPDQNDIDDTNRVHPTAIIGDDVVLGAGNAIGPYTVIMGPCTIGDGNWIGPNVCIGAPAEMRGTHHAAGWSGEPGRGLVAIGNRNVIREFTSIQAPTTGTTVIGDDCYLMDKVHIPHDCSVEDRVTVSCAVMLGGHTFLGAGSNIGLGCVVHQRIAIGRGAMLGMGSIITRHIDPYALAYGAPARIKGANRIGLERAGFAPDTIADVDEALKNGESLEALLPNESGGFLRAIQLVES